MSNDNQNSKSQKTDNDEIIGNVTDSEYKYGFVTDIDTDVIPGGLKEVSYD